jgi:hypothetical protein
MQWYVYLIATAAIVYWVTLSSSWSADPYKACCAFDAKLSSGMAFFERISLPQARELAISSQAIQAYDLAVRNVREAHCTFHDLGTQLLALGESEPTIRILMNFFGLNVVLAGHALINRFADLCHGKDRKRPKPSRDRSSAARSQHRAGSLSATFTQRADQYSA